jgi:hypothetical protein
MRRARRIYRPFTPTLWETHKMTTAERIDGKAKAASMSARITEETASLLEELPRKAAASTQSSTRSPWTQHRMMFWA